VISIGWRRSADSARLQVKIPENRRLSGKISEFGGFDKPTGVQKALPLTNFLTFPCTTQQGNDPTDQGISQPNSEPRNAGVSFR
jgi:hypothetical protein